MKKITKVSIDALREKLPVLNVEEQKEVVGAAFVYDLSGNFITSNGINGSYIYIRDNYGMDTELFYAHLARDCEERVLSHITQNAAPMIDEVKLGYYTHQVEYNGSLILYASSKIFYDNDSDYYKIQSNIRGLYKEYLDSQYTGTYYAPTR